MAFFACGTRDKPYIRPLRPGAFLYRYSFWAGLASTTSSKVNKPASNFRRSLAERKSWRAELCSAFGMGAPESRGSRAAHMNFIASSARKGKHLMCFRLAQDCRAGKFICAARLPRLSGASLMQKLSWGKVRGQWRFIPRNSKKLKIHYKFALTLGN